MNVVIMIVLLWTLKTTIVSLYMTIMMTLKTDVGINPLNNLKSISYKILYIKEKR